MGHPATIFVCDSAILHRVRLRGAPGLASGVLLPGQAAATNFSSLFSLFTNVDSHTYMTSLPFHQVWVKYVQVSQTIKREQTVETNLQKAISLLAGLILLLGISLPPGGFPQAMLVILSATPFLIAPFFPMRGAALFATSFLVGYGTALALVLWPVSFGALIFSFDKRPGVLYLVMALAVSAALFSGGVGLVRVPKSERGAVPGGIVMGLLYFPVLLAALFTGFKPVVAHAEDLYWPAACALKQYTEHGQYAKSIKQIEKEPGCGNLGTRLSYEPMRTGFVLQTRSGEPRFFTDESGIIRVGALDGQAANLGASTLALTKNELREWQRRHSGYPPTLDEIYQQYPGLPDRMKRSGYVFQYFQSGSLSFRLVARPLNYGRSGLRSYYTDESLGIHGTPFDRTATPLDPEVTNCEASELSCTGEGLLPARR
jgi:hypothetical protein